jgi:hypothetical protein
MQDSDLDNSALNTIIVDIPFALISRANQDTQNKDSTNQEAQESRDSGLDREHTHLLTLALISPSTTNAPPLTTTLTNGQNSLIDGQNSPIKEETHSLS